jgi:UDP-N-acetylmuramoyl-tripeptide--D-alanyl-D-alanine ligase
MMLTLAQTQVLLQALLPGSTLHAATDAAQLAFVRVHSDTRSLQAGDLFVALRGDTFDAHSFLAQARSAGAVAALVDHVPADTTLPCIVVPDTLLALQQLAAQWRMRFSGPLIAVTGSNGKTTVTQMVAAILHAWHGDAALATAGNFNNHIGVPLTLLRLRHDDPGQHRSAVLELGMNHAGEIALLAGLARPTVALVNNAQREHQEFLDGVEAVARENGQVISALAADGTAVLPSGDAHLPLWKSMAGARRVWTFAAGALGTGAQADVTAQGCWIDSPQSEGYELQLYTPAGGADTTLAMAGQHNLWNAAAATACALAAGAPLAAVARGLAAFRPVAGRSQMLHLLRQGRAVTLIDDSYNANPDSVRAAIDVLASLPGPRWLILGDMGEVGTQGPQFHDEVGGHAQDSDIETVWAVGDLCRHARAHRHFDNVAQLLAALPQGPAAASILVKGSRFMKMEQAVQALQSEGAAHAA